VGGVRPLEGEREARFGKGEVCRRTKVSHIGWEQKWHRAIDLHGEGQGGQGGMVAGGGSMRGRVAG